MASSLRRRGILPVETTVKHRYTTGDVEREDTYEIPDGIDATVYGDPPPGVPPSYPVGEARGPAAHAVANPAAMIRVYGNLGPRAADAQEWYNALFINVSASAPITHVLHALYISITRAIGGAPDIFGRWDRGWNAGNLNYTPACISYGYRGQAGVFSIAKAGIASPIGTLAVDGAELEFRFNFDDEREPFEVLYGIRPGLLAPDALQEQIRDTQAFSLLPMRETYCLGAAGTMIPADTTAPAIAAFDHEVQIIRTLEPTTLNRETGYVTCPLTLEDWPATTPPANLVSYISGVGRRVDIHPSIFEGLDGGFENFGSLIRLRLTIDLRDYLLFHIDQMLVAGAGAAMADLRGRVAPPDDQPNYLRQITVQDFFTCITGGRHAGGVLFDLSYFIRRIPPENLESEGPDRMGISTQWIMFILHHMIRSYALANDLPAPADIAAFGPSDTDFVRYFAARGEPVGVPRVRQPIPATINVRVVFEVRHLYDARAGRYFDEIPYDDARSVMHRRNYRFSLPAFVGDPVDDVYPRIIDHIIENLGVDITGYPFGFTDAQFAPIPLGATVTTTVYTICVDARNAPAMRERIHEQAKLEDLRTQHRTLDAANLGHGVTKNVQLIIPGIDDPPNFHILTTIGVSMDQIIQFIQQKIAELYGVDISNSPSIGYEFLLFSAPFALAIEPDFYCSRLGPIIHVRFDNPGATAHGMAIAGRLPVDAGIYAFLPAGDPTDEESLEILQRIRGDGAGAADDAPWGRSSRRPREDDEDLPPSKRARIEALVRRLAAIGLSVRRR